MAKKKIIKKKVNPEGKGLDITGDYGGLPSDMSVRIGECGIRKSTVEGVQVVCWDAVDDCDPATCPISDSCEYEYLGRRAINHNKRVREEGRDDWVEMPVCKMQREFLYQCYKMALNAFAGDLTQEIVTKIGFHLIPLYLDLIQIYILLKGDPERVYLTGGGQKKINPLYKEKREIIRSIHDAWKMLNLDVSQGFEEGIGALEDMKEGSFLVEEGADTMKVAKEKLEAGRRKVQKRVDGSKNKYAKY